MWAPALVWLWAQPALACAVCGGGDTEANQWAFLWTTAFLSLLPLAMIGGVAFYVWRATREPAPPRLGAVEPG